MDDIADICLSLTNFHICWHPLRDEDREYYLSILSALKVQSEEARKKGRACQLRHKRHCQQIEMILEQDEVINNSNSSEGK